MLDILIILDISLDVVGKSKAYRNIKKLGFTPQEIQIKLIFYL